MYVKSTSNNNATTFTIDDATFAKIIAVYGDGVVDLEITYNVSQLYAFRNEAYAVNVLLRKNAKGDAKTSMPTSPAGLGKQLMSTLTKGTQGSKSAATEQQACIVVKKQSSVLANVDKTCFTKLAALAENYDEQSISTDPNLTHVTFQYVKVSGLRNASITLPVTQRYLVNNDENDQLTQQSMSQATSYGDATVSGASQNLLSQVRTVQEARLRCMRRGFSSSMLASTMSRVQSVTEALEGTSRYVKGEDDVESVVNSLTIPLNVHEKTSDDLSTDQLVVVPTVSYDDMLQCSVVVQLVNPFDGWTTDVPVTQYQVSLALVNVAENRIIDTITRNIELSTLVNAHYTPLSKPEISVATISDSRTNVNICSRESSVTVMKKIVGRMQQFDKNVGFSTIVDKRSTSNGCAQFVDAPQNSSTVIYRAVSVGKTGVVGSEFNEVVVKPARFCNNKFVSIVALQTKSSVSIELRGLSHDVVSAQVLRRDLTLHEKTYSCVSNPQLVLKEHRQNGVLIVQDTDVLKSDHSYEYSVDLIFKSGVKETCGSTLLEYVPFVDGIETTVSGLVVTDGSQLDVAFSVSTTVTQSDLDDIVAMLSAQNLKEYFNVDVLREREKLQKLIAHSVVRVDLTTGERENCGVLTTAQFVDSDFRKMGSLSNLDRSHVYRYEISVLLRSSETMFSDLVVSKVDVTTGKQYSYKPSKFQHPITLKAGSLVSPDTLRTLHGQKAMMYGRVGNVCNVDVRFGKMTVIVSGQTAAQFDDRIIVSWYAKGSTSIVDHYVVVGITNGIRTIIGTVHASPTTGECSCTVKVESYMRGSTSYAIVPVLNDYTQLAEVLTNEIVVK